MEKVRFWIIGMGGVGMHHAGYIACAEPELATLVAFSTRDAGRLAEAQENFLGGGRAAVLSRVVEGEGA